MSGITSNSSAAAVPVADERDILDSEARYRTLFDCIDEGFCIIEFLDGPHDPLSDYIHVAANAAYAANAGIPNVVGQRVRDMVPDEADGQLTWVGGWSGCSAEIIKARGPADAGPRAFA